MPVITSSCSSAQHCAGYHEQLQFGPTLCRLSRAAAVRPNINTVPVITSSCSSGQHCASYHEQLHFGPTLCRFSRVAAFRPNILPVIKSRRSSARHCAGYHSLSFAYSSVCPQFIYRKAVKPTESSSTFSYTASLIQAVISNSPIMVQHLDCQCYLPRFCYSSR